MGGKPISKIAKSEARACADDLILALESGGNLGEVTTGLVQKYTVGSRTMIVEQTLDLVTGKRRPRIDEDVLATFIKQFAASPKPQGLDKLIVSLACLADAALPNRGCGWGAGILALQFGGAQDSFSSISIFLAVGESLRNRDDHLAESLEVILLSKAPVAAIQLWESMLRPAIGDLSRPYSISQKATSKILVNLSKLPPEHSSETLPPLISILLSQSDADSRSAFLNTPIGKTFREKMLGKGQEINSAAGQDPDANLIDGDRQLLRLIRDRLVEGQNELKRSLDEMESKREVELNNYRDRLRNSQAEEERLRKSIQALRVEVQQVKENEERSAEQIAAKDNDLLRQEAEIRQLEREKKSQETDQVDRHLEVIRTNLVGPAAKVRDLIVEICNSRDGTKIEPRILAVAFDSLHKRILNLADIKDERIPQHILAGKKK